MARRRRDAIAIRPHPMKTRTTKSVRNRALQGPRTPGKVCRKIARKSDCGSVFVATEKRSCQGVMEKRRKDAIKDLMTGDMADKKCCDSRRCFQVVDAMRLASEAEILASMSRKDRRDYIKSLLHVDSGVFFFNGKTVCSTFLEKAFRLSRDLQISL